MADEFGDGEFWLPSEFLSEDVVMGKSSAYAGSGGGGGCGAAPRDGVWFPSEFPYGGCDLGSPVESVVGSTETESDGEDFGSGELSRRLTGSLLLDDLLPGHGWDVKEPKANLKSSSPQSPLCAMGSWGQYGHGGGSSRSSSNGPSQLSSPPSTPYAKPDDAWELLSAAAGQVVRLKLNEEAHRLCSRGLLGVPPRKPASTGYFSNPAFAHQQLQNAKLQQLQKQQWGVRGKQGDVCSSKNGGKGGRQAYCLSSPAWPSLQSQPQQQQQPSAGMRAVFLGGGGSRPESAGTGVFLPRRPGTPTDLLKKPACSTVLVPARVVQALNLNLDEMGSAHPRLPPTFARQSAHYREQWPARSDVPLSMFQKSTHSVPPAAAISPEFRLPPEWTY